MTDWLTTLESDWHSIAANRAEAAKAARAALGAHPWTDDLAIETPSWLVPGLLQRKAIHVLSSDKGCYKTWLGLSLLTAGIYGTPVLGEKPLSKFSTIYVAADSPDWDISQQLRKLLLANNLRPDFADTFILPFGIQFTNEKHVSALAELASCYDIDHLVIDVKGYTQGHLDENSDTEQMLYYRVMKHFRDKLGMAVTILHHFGKINKTARGAGTVEQAAEHAFHLIKTKTGVLLRREKIRGDELWTDRLFSLGHQNGGRLLVPVEAPVTPAEEPAPPEAPSEPKEDRILLALSTSKTREQLGLVAVSMGKTQKWLDNRLQYLKRQGQVETDGKGTWTISKQEVA